MAVTETSRGCLVLWVTIFHNGGSKEAGEETRVRDVVGVFDRVVAGGCHENVVQRRAGVLGTQREEGVEQGGSSCLVFDFVLTVTVQIGLSRTGRRNSSSCLGSGTGTKNGCLVGFVGSGRGGNKPGNKRVHT